MNLINLDLPGILTSYYQLSGFLVGISALYFGFNKILRLIR
jgi:hypothetical protein